MVYYCYWNNAYFKEQYDFGAFVMLLNKVAKTFIEDDLLLPLRDDWFVLLEVIRLGHDGENVVNVFLLIKWGYGAMTTKKKNKMWTEGKICYNSKVLALLSGLEIQISVDRA